jgi:hypothetical protein
MKIRVILKLLIGVGAFAILGFFLVKLGKVISKASDDNMRGLAENLPIGYEITQEDSSLFVRKYWDKIVVQEVYRSKVRNPISVLVFDNKYYLILYKIKINSNAPVTELVNYKVRDADRSVGISYAIVDRGGFRLQYKGGAPPPASEIMLSLEGSDINNYLKNDGMTAFSMQLKGAAIRYSVAGPEDLLFGKGWRATENVSCNFVFKKREDAVFLIVSLPLNPDLTVPAYLLTSIVSEE